MMAMEAITLEDLPRLRLLISKLRDADVTVEILAESGIAILLDDLTPWTKAKVGAQAELLRDKWRSLLVEAHKKGTKVEMRSWKDTATWPCSWRSEASTTQRPWMA